MTQKAKFHAEIDFEPAIALKASTYVEAKSEIEGLDPHNDCHLSLYDAETGSLLAERIRWAPDWEPGLDAERAGIEGADSADELAEAIVDFRNELAN